MMAAFESFVAEPLRYRRADLAWYRLSQLLHERTNGKYDAIHMQMARIMRPKVTLPPSAQFSPSDVTNAVAQLQSDGYMVLPFGLTEADIAELSEFAYSTPAHGTDMDKSVTVTPGNFPLDEPRYSWWMHELVRLPVVQRLIAEGPYCAMAQEYLGCRPVLAHVSLFLDAPYPGDYGAYFYHYDNEGPGFLKFFFYLTDVEVGTGAHYFIAGTQAHRKPERFARASFYKEEELFGWYQREKEVAVCGPAGTILVEDTAGFHRGSHLQRGFRLLMQFEFSAMNVPTSHELARKLVPLPVPGLHPGIASIARKFYVTAAK